MVETLENKMEQKKEANLVEQSFQALPQPLHIRDTEAAHLTGISRMLWHRLRVQGKVPRNVKLGRRVLWNRQEIIDWIAAKCPDRKTWEAMRKT
jgi:predicted DNA-binding transcriptional regulator AlpA